MTHHRIAAHTASPKVWLQKAADNKWSALELRDAIRGRHVDDEYRSQVERLAKAVRKCNDTWGGKGNIRAVLIWERSA